MNRLQILVAPAPDAVETAADLILMLLAGARREPDAPPPGAVHVRTNPKTQQIEIIAEYPKIKASAPLLHPLKTVKKANRGTFTSYRKHRRCTASASLLRRN